MARDSRTGKIRVTYEKTVKRTSTGRLRHPHIAWAKQRPARSRARSCGVEFKATVRDERNEEAAFQAQKQTFKPSSDVFYAIFRHEILKFCWSDPAIKPSHPMS